MKRDVSAAAVGVKSACNLLRLDRAAAGLRMHITFDLVDLNVARSRFGMYPFPNA